MTDDLESEGCGRQVRKLDTQSKAWVPIARAAEAIRSSNSAQAQVRDTHDSGCEFGGSFTRTASSPASEKRARTIFSPSPTHLDVSEDAEMLKKVAPIKVMLLQSFTF